MPSEISWLTALSGGLAGAVLTQMASLLLWWVRRPRIRLTFAEGQTGCSVVTPARLTPHVHGKQRWLRIHVQNRGWTTAHQVNVSATEIVFYGKSGPTLFFGEEVLDLRLANVEPPRSIFDLAPGQHRFVDFFAVEDLEDGKGANPFFEMHNRPDRLGLLPFDIGSYSAYIIATAEDATARKLRINFEWQERSVDGLVIRARLSRGTKSGLGHERSCPSLPASRPSAR
jgi:hypothetical protein